MPMLASETSLPHLLAHLDEVQPDLMVVDSIQTISDPGLSSAPGTVVQVRETVELGELDPEQVVTPGIYVKRVVRLAQLKKAA